MIKKFLFGLMLGCGIAVFVTAIVHPEKVSAEHHHSRDDERNRGYVENKINDAWMFLNKGSTSRAFRYLTSAKMYFKRISPAGQEDAGTVALKARLDGLANAVHEQKVIEKEAHQHERALTQQKADYCAIVHSHIGLLFMLKAGKNGDAPYSLSKLNAFRTLFDRLDINVTEFKQRFALLIENQPTYDYGGMTVNDVLDLLENRLVYRDALVIAECRNDLAGLLNDLAEAYSTLETFGKINSNWLDELYGANAGRPYQLVETLLSYYEWVGEAAPQETLYVIAAFKNRFRNLLEKKSSTQQIRLSDYSYTTAAMERVAAAKGEELKMQLMHVGMIFDDEWMIIKNRAGIPLQRTGKGCAVYHKKEEPFLRSYDVNFFSEFNGNGYAPVSKAVLSHNVLIVGRK